MEGEVRVGGLRAETKAEMSRSEMKGVCQSGRREVSSSGALSLGFRGGVGGGERGRRELPLAVFDDIDSVFESNAHIGVSSGKGRVEGGVGCVLVFVVGGGRW